MCYMYDVYKQFTVDTAFKSSTLPEFNNLASLFENWKQPIINSFIRDYNNKRYSVVNP